MTNVVLRGVELVNVEISGFIENVTVNGVDIGPLVEAELDRRDPDRAKMRPADPAGFARRGTFLSGYGTDRGPGRKLPPELLHESVDEEWSFTETLRHLTFATDSWVGRAILGDRRPGTRSACPGDGMPDTPGVPCDRAATGARHRARAAPRSAGHRARVP